MKCSQCGYNFALYDENYDGTQVCCKYDVGKYVAQIEKDKKERHKCYGCPWGTWTGTKYKCALPRCMPKLGDFNGVDRK